MDWGTVIGLLGVLGGLCTFAISRPSLAMRISVELFRAARIPIYFVLGAAMGGGAVTVVVGTFVKRPAATVDAAALRETMIVVLHFLAGMCLTVTLLSVGFLVITYLARRAYQDDHQGSANDKRR